MMPLMMPESDAELLALRERRDERDDTYVYALYAAERRR